MYPVVDMEVVFEKLRGIERAAAEEGSEHIPRHMQCTLPFHGGWNSFAEVIPEDMRFSGLDPGELGLILKLNLYTKPLNR
jgi:hypothetical protein